MLEILVSVILVALVVSSIFQYSNGRKHRVELQEYKDLFNLADSSTKEERSKVEELLKNLARKDVLLDRSAQVIEIATQGELEFREEIVGLRSLVAFQEEQYAKLFGQKKSSEVRVGKVTEQIAPFLADYPLDSHTARFIGDPIDIVHFDADKITFVEVKSGKSQLSKKQRGIRDLIKEGKVEFIVYRVEGK